MTALGDAEADALVSAVREVSRREILPRFRSLGGDEIGTKSNADDLVTVADHAAEAGIAAAIREILPDARVIGEEAVSEDPSLLDGVAESGLSVVVDPIDGTWNFANGIATYGVILAVIENGETVMGLLYDPSFDDWVIARAGAGSWFVRAGAAPVRLSVRNGARTAAEAFGFVGLYLFGRDDRPRIAETLPAFRRTMTLRCSCHEYRVQALGRADFALSAMLNVWDHAAGVLAIREAGGVARLLDGRDYAPVLRTGRLLTAANESLWERLADLWR